MTTDERYMNLCFEIAKSGAGFTSPNPLVGAVIVKDNKVISTGCHEKYGGAHAEINAINNSLENVKESTLYCNLEPCVHLNKQTPPCVPAIVSSGIRKVVIANIDPNPFVSGKGIEALISNGIDVQLNVLKEEGEELNKIYFKYVRTGLPYVTLKIASSADNKITRSNDSQTWLTGPDSKIFVHQKRAVYDAILVGANTINVDNPELTVREIKGRNPVRIILDGNFFSNTESKLFNDKKSRTLIIGSKSGSHDRKEKFRSKGIEVIEIEPEYENRLSLKNILVKLSELKITSLLVEGGGDVFKQFIEAGLVDELILLKAPVFLKEGIDMPAISFSNYSLYYSGKIDEDFLSVYKKS